MQIVKTDVPDSGVATLARYIATNLKRNKRVLWLVSGGSNIPHTIIALGKIEREVGLQHLKNLTITLTDERYGHTGHRDSNWRQLIKAGFGCQQVETIPVLIGQPIDKTIETFSKRLRAAYRKSDLIVVQLGMGADSHIAGIIPDSAIARSRRLVASCATPQFRRISITFAALKNVDAIFVFVFGPSKHEAVRKLLARANSRIHEPAQSMKRLGRVKMYTDCL